MADKIPTLAITGGFLGAGKTTLILKAAELLRAQDKRAAVILNDQDAGLVDTEHARALGVAAREVANGCFCCRFSELVNAARQLAEYRPHVIFAEPVGSCIDLAATVMQPLLESYSDELRLAPLTVLLDPETAERRLRGELGEEVAYLASQQLAEADLICSSRQDIYPRAPRLPFPVDFCISGKTGFGVDAWLCEIMQPTRVFGAKLLDVDYQRYGDAEAALGWLNLHAEVVLAKASSPAALCGPLLDQLQQSLLDERIVIAHIKIFDRCGTGWVRASVCANDGQVSAEGDLLADAAVRHEFAINMRAVADPELLERHLRASLAGIEGAFTIRHLRTFSPPPPTPEFPRGRHAKRT